MALPDCLFVVHPLSDVSAAAPGRIIMQPAEFTVPAQVANFDIATEFVNLL